MTSAASFTAVVRRVGKALIQINAPNSGPFDAPPLSRRSHTFGKLVFVTLKQQVEIDIAMKFELNSSFANFESLNEKALQATSDSPQRRLFRNHSRRRHIPL